MGSPGLNNSENEKLRILVKRALESGDYSSYSDLGNRTGIGETTLYPFMRRKSGLSRTSADALRPYLAKYDRSRAKRVHDPEGRSIVISPPSSNRKSNGHTNGKANGSSNGSANGHAKLDGDSTSKVQLTRDVMNKLFELRETTTDAGVRAAIDEITANWALDGLRILATAAARN